MPKNCVRWPQRMNAKICRSRLAGERGGSVTKAAAEQMRSPASRLLQNREKSTNHSVRGGYAGPALAGNERGSCAGTCPSCLRWSRWMNANFCRSRLAGECGGSVIKVAAEQMLSPASRLLQNREKSTNHSVRGGYVGPALAGNGRGSCAGTCPSCLRWSRWMNASFCRSRLAGECGGSVTKPAAEQVLSPASRLLQNREKSTIPRRSCCTNSSCSCS